MITSLILFPTHQANAQSVTAGKEGGSVEGTSGRKDWGNRNEEKGQEEKKRRREKKERNVWEMNNGRIGERRRGESRGGSSDVKHETSTFQTPRINGGNRKEEGLTHQPLVSILASTTPGRNIFFESLLESFRRQTYPNKELIVFEDSAGPPSDFWSKLGDVRVRHFHEMRADADKMGISDKHVRMMRLARGDFMAVFDDDDYYGAEYIEFMLTNLRQRNVSLVKLGHWPSFFARWHLQGTPPKRVLSGNFFLFDVASSDRWDQQYGYAFSYVFSRQAAEANASCPTSQTSMWDCVWVESLHKMGFKIAILTELPPFLVIKIQHSDNITAQLYVGGQALLLRTLQSSVGRFNVGTCCCAPPSDPPSHATAAALHVQPDDGRGCAAQQV